MGRCANTPPPRLTQRKKTRVNPWGLAPGKRGRGDGDAGANHHRQNAVHTVLPKQHTHAKGDRGSSQRTSDG